ncbi:MAG: FAD:protein FMN transferase [Planctomycetes bacterium]|nr:FAD:protein FMN transferase [Planctomycetota bacterium]
MLSLLLTCLGSLSCAPAQEPTPAPVSTPEEPKLYMRALGVMGTDLEIKVIDADEAKANKALDAAVAELQRIEDMMTTWRDSPLNDLNAKAGQGFVEVPEELAELVARSLAVAEATHGAFDPTFASVGKLWDFKAIPPKLPSDAEIAEALKNVGYKRVQVDLEGHRIALPKGTRIGLGGIAKGYGVDRAMAVLLKHGIQNGIVNAGGDLKALGTKFGEPWRIAIKHPRKGVKPVAIIPLSNVCLVTSGDYERFFMVDGKRYHHILDPRSGRPAVGCISATVLAPDAAFADALATAMVVLGPTEGLKVIEAIPRVEALLVDLDGNVFRSSGLKEDQAKAE